MEKSGPGSCRQRETDSISDRKYQHGCSYLFSCVIFKALIYRLPSSVVVVFVFLLLVIIIISRSTAIVTVLAIIIVIFVFFITIMIGLAAEFFQIISQT